MNIVFERIEIVAFGKLSGVTLNPDKGINILTAPNESGKSTLASFIKFVFYGFAGVLKKTVTDNERQLYMPWDMPRASGSITVRCEQGTYKVSRSYILPSKETVSIVNTRNGNTEFEGCCPGEVLFGINEEVFSKSVFSQQTAQHINRDESLSDNIKALVFSETDKESSSHAQKRLIEAKNTLIGRGGKGIIPSLEASLLACSAEYEKATANSKEILKTTEEINATERAIKANRAKIEILSAEKENIQRYDALLHLNQLRELSDEEERALKEFSAAKAEFSGEEMPSTETVNALVAQCINYNKKVTACEELSRISQAKQQEKEKFITDNPLLKEETNVPKIKAMLTRTNIFTIIFFILSIICVCAAIVFWYTEAPVINEKYSDALIIMTAAIGVLLATMAFLFTHSSKKRVLDYGYTSLPKLKSDLLSYPDMVTRLETLNNECELAQAEYFEAKKQLASERLDLEEELQRYVDFEATEDYGDIIQALSISASRASSLGAVYQSKKKTFSDALAEVNIEKLAEKANGAKKPERESAVVEREIKFYSDQNSSLAEKLRTLENKKASLEAVTQSPAVLYGQLEALADRLKSYKRKHASLELAIKALEDAGEQMKATVSPRLTRLASEYFQAAVDNKYTSLTLDTNFSMTYDDTYNERSIEYLSMGTKDLAFLCLRLALAELLFDGSRPPIILDDTFGHLDDNRLKNAIAVLARCEKNGQQIFILTCHDRESRLLRAMNVDAVTITL